MNKGTHFIGQPMYGQGVPSDIKKTRAKLVSLLTNDMDMEPEDIVEIYRKRWEIELLFKQLKQNFPLRYSYGESANAIKIQITELCSCTMSTRILSLKHPRKTG